MDHHDSLILCMLCHCCFARNNSLDDSFAAMQQRVGLENQETPQNRLIAADTTTSYLDTSDLDNSVLVRVKLSLIHTLWFTKDHL